MLGAGIDPQTAQLVPANRIRRDHALYRQLHGELGLGAHQRVIPHSLQMADIPGMVIVILLLQLAAGEDGVLAVHNDHMIAAVHMGGKGGLVLASEQHGGLSGHTAKGLSGGVDHIPAALDLSGLRHRS